MIGGLKHVVPLTMMIQEILLLSFVAPRQQRFVVLVDFSLTIHQIRRRTKTPEAARIVFVCCNGRKATGAAVDILKNYPSSPSIQLMTKDDMKVLFCVSFHAAVNRHVLRS